MNYKITFEGKKMKTFALIDRNNPKKDPGY